MKARGAKLLVTVTSQGKGTPIITESVYDYREEAFWLEDRIKERGITSFLDLADLKESLNWNLNGDASKYRFRWDRVGKTRFTGRALIFD